MSITANEIFAAMGEAVHGDSGKTLRRKFKGSVVFTISDINEVYTLDLKSATASVTKHDDNTPPPMTKPDLAVSVKSDDMIKLISGELKPQQAFMKGKLKVKGKMGLAMKLTSVLVATKKKLPSSKL